jgi:hypothetical protein
MKLGNLYFLHILWLLLLSTIIKKAHAQEEKLRFEHLGVEQSLADNSAIWIIQDKKGYLWFGTKWLKQVQPENRRIYLVST